MRNARSIRAKYGKAFFANRETLPTIREKELRDACRVLGIEDLRLLGLRDKTVEFEDPEKIADQIEAVIREVHPTIVMTYYPEHGVHPDHDGLSAATVIAVKRIPPEQRPVIYGSAVTNHAEEFLGKPDIVNDITDVLDIKLDAMRAHRSQSEAMMAQMEKDMEDPETKKKIEKMLTTERFWIYSV